MGCYSGHQYSGPERAGEKSNGGPEVSGYFIVNDHYLYVQVLARIYRTL
jgi:hypothetical protein